MTSPSSVRVMNTPMRESWNLSAAKNRARIKLGMPAVNMRNERSVMMIYASRPTEFKDVMPRKSDTRDKAVGGIVATQGRMWKLRGCEEACQDTRRIEKAVSRQV